MSYVNDTLSPISLEGLESFLSLHSPFLMDRDRDQ